MRGAAAGAEAAPSTWASTARPNTGSTLRPGPAGRRPPAGSLRPRREAPGPIRAGSRAGARVGQRARLGRAHPPGPTGDRRPRLLPELPDRAGEGAVLRRGRGNRERHVETDDGSAAAIEAPEDAGEIRARDRLPGAQLLECRVVDRHDDDLRRKPLTTQLLDDVERPYLDRLEPAQRRRRRHGKRGRRTRRPELAKTPHSARTRPAGRRRRARLRIRHRAAPGRGRATPRFRSRARTPPRRAIPAHTRRAVAA